MKVHTLIPSTVALLGGNNMYIYMYIYIYIIYIYIMLFYCLLPEDYFNNMKLLVTMM